MALVFGYFLAFLAAAAGIFWGLSLRGGLNFKRRRPSSESTYAPPVVTLDDSEIKDLGHRAARWCSSWIYSSSADHKWLTIEINRFRMKCAGINKETPFDGYPSLAVDFSKEVSPESVHPIAQKILDIISVECPEMINTYGLYKDGSFLILPTNSK